MPTLLHRFPLPKQPAEFDHELINRAITLAFVAHHGQYRKDGVTPQILHPLAVQRLLAKYGIKDARLHAAALVHDAIEDNIFERGQWLRTEISNALGSDVLEIVDSLTDTAPAHWSWASRKEKQMMDIAEAKWSTKLIKLADIVASIQEGPAPNWAQQHACDYLKQRNKMVLMLSDTSVELTAAFADAIRQPIWQNAINASGLGA